MQWGKTWKFCENIAGKVSKYELKIEELDSTRNTKFFNFPINFWLSKRSQVSCFSSLVICGR